MEQILWLADPIYTRKFQEFCGVEPPKANLPDSKTDSSGKINKAVKQRNGCSNGSIQLNNGIASTQSKPNYTIRYKPLYYLAKFGAVLGDELFYLIFFPFWLWNVNSVIGRQTSFVWCLIMYMGQATKDYFRVPRPSAPPVLRLESTHLQEYSMPSTHAMSGVGIPGALLFIMVTRYGFPVLPALLLGFSWATLVCLCRLYLGVHSLLDVIGGAVYAAAILCCALPYVQEFDSFIQTHPYAPIVVLITALAMCTICYPCKDQNSAKGDAVQTVSIVAGVCIGLWFNNMIQSAAQPEVQPSVSGATFSLSWIGLSILRLFSGALIIFLVREVVQVATVKGFSYLYGLKRPDKAHPQVETPYKFITYMSMGICVMTLVPTVHKIMGIIRPNYFFEVK